MSHSSRRVSQGRETTKALDARRAEVEQRPAAGAALRPAGSSKVGWRYGSALAAARALNARPAEA